MRLSLLDEVGPEGFAALEAEAARLSEWLDGTVVNNVYSSHQMKWRGCPQ